jgi:hypothetical protein
VVQIADETRTVVFSASFVPPTRAPACPGVPEGVEFRDRSGMWYPADRLEKLDGLSEDGCLRWIAYPPDGYQLPRSRWWSRKIVDPYRIGSLPMMTSLRVVLPVPGKEFRSSDFSAEGPRSETP